MNSRQNCPVCMEDIHTSRDSAHISDCGHLMHSKCFKMYLRKGQYRCPICGVSLGNMDDVWKKVSLFGIDKRYVLQFNGVQKL